MKFKHLFFAAALFSIARCSVLVTMMTMRSKFLEIRKKTLLHNPTRLLKQLHQPRQQACTLLMQVILATMLMEHFLLLTLKKEQQATMYFLT